ncbi:MAG: DNA-primase RepB domain-containing protein [Thermodesulfobacteriota bacterium]|nr:DNA-primase RepB domain-containing protein [Thermodesulfobacteriota bacterium]
MGDTRQQPDRRAFLETMYAYCEGRVELRALIPGEEKTPRTFADLGDHKKINAFCQTHARRDLYFAVATRNGGGTKEHIVHIPGAWVDIDFKDIPQAEAKKKLAEFSLRPSFVIRSGGGYHGYWLYKEPLSKDDIAEHEYLLKQLASHFEGDMAATDASRILRLPDTKNFKYRPPASVKIVQYNDLRYDPSDFEFLPNLDARSASATSREHSIICTNTLYRGTPEVQHSEAVQQPLQHGSTSSTFLNFQQGHRDESLFSIADHLRKGGMPRPSIEKIITFCAKNCTPAFPEREALAKVKSAFSRGERQDEGLTQRIREFVSSTWGSIR